MTARTDGRGTGWTTARPAPDFRGRAVPAEIAERALLPGEDGYHRYTASYFRGARPGLVLRPQTIPELQQAVRFAAGHRDVPLSLLSGGHGLSGRSLNTGGIVLSLKALSEVTVLQDRRVRIGPGARWSEVAQTLAPHGLAITSGDYGGVGVGGLATTAGMGWFVREHGLTIDHLRSVELVTADGELVQASAEQHPDLFWAVRGAGANVGVVASFEFEAHPVADQVGFAVLTFVAEDVSTFLQSWGTSVEDADPTVTGTLVASSRGRGEQTVVQAMLVVDSADPDTVVERLQPFAALAPMADQSVRMTPYAALLAAPPGGEDQHGRGEPHAHSASVRHLSPEVADRLADLMAAESPVFVSLRSTGGAVAEVAAEETAYAWRQANFLVATVGGRAPDVERAWARLLPSTEGMNPSFETDTGPDVLARAFPPEHLRRLRRIKRRWDPTGLFRDNFFVDPEVVLDDEAAAGSPGPTRPEPTRSA